MGNMDVEKPSNDAPAGGPPAPGPGQKPVPPTGGNSKAAKFYEAKKGYANFHFNKLATADLVKSFQKHGDFTTLGGSWKVDGKIELADRGGDVTLTWIADKDGAIEVKLARGTIEDAVKPLGVKMSEKAELLLPQGSGGMLVALNQYRLLLTQLEKGFGSNSNATPGFVHGGHEPFYPMPADGKAPENYTDIRVDCDVLRTKQAQFESKWYFSQKDGTLLGGEVTSFKEEDPCELYFSDYKDVGGRKLPHRIDVRTGDKRYAVLTVRTYTLEKK